MKQNVIHKLLEQKFKSHLGFKKQNDHHFTYKNDGHIVEIFNGKIIDIGDRYEFSGLIVQRTGEKTYLLVKETLVENNKN